ncbi:MAG: hypothetical protein J6U20_08955 [Fibrobacter sp.]|nr:hypothetical protein [Fibrobacter sp.]
MFFKYWKKIALTLTGFFWASCGGDSNSTDSGVDPVCEYGVEVPHESSSSFVEPSSSLVETSSSIAESSSSSIEESSSSSIEAYSSSSIEAYSSSSEALAYSSFSAVYAPQTPCNLTDTAATTCDFDSLFSSKSTEYTNKIYAISCKQYKCDSKTCTEATAQVDSEHNPSSECDENGCVDYSLLSSTEKKYTCSDGKTYDQIEFNARYHINEEKN